MKLSNGCSDLLNFLVYLQNLYLNNQKKDKKSPPSYFPYFEIDDLGFLGSTQFEIEFSRSWLEAVSIRYNHKKDSLYQNLEIPLLRSLFQENEMGLAGLHSTYKSFLVWWDPHFYGANYFMETVAQKVIPELYTHLKERLVMLERDIPTEHVRLDIIFDEVSLGSVKRMPYYYIVTQKQLLAAERNIEKLVNIIIENSISGD